MVLNWGHTSRKSRVIWWRCVQLHCRSSLLLRKDFSEFVSFNYKYPIAISHSVTSEKYVDLFYILIFIYKNAFCSFY
jgi:hypothetical protein